MIKEKIMSKKIWIPLVVLGALVVIFAIVFPIIYCCVINVDLKASATQVDDTTNINVQWDTSEPVDRVTIEVKHKGDLVNQQVITDVGDILKGNSNIEAYYGNMDVSVTIKKGIYTTTDTAKVALSTSEYNFAPLTATMPVTLFSLSLNEITQDGTIPTYVWFKRSGAWDWSALPNGVYPMPTIGTYDFLNSAEEKMYAETSAYIKELYEIDNTSKFNLYYNDYFAYGWVQATIDNGIPQQNYKVVLLSDGTASFAYFNEHFDNANAETEYAEMAEDWQTLKEQVAEKGSYNKNTNGVAISADDLREYAFVMAREESNVEWWLTRINGTLATNNADFYSVVESTANVKVKDLNTLLNAMDETQKNDLKTLYKFSDSMFEQAETENKKAMVILGTWTQNEYNFDDYVKAIQAYYGDEYIYYYKGHPKNPTNTVEGKLEHLESLGLTDVDSTIPAELIIFFNPEIYLSGYSTSSFVSVPSPDKCCALFHTNKANADASYKDNMEFFITKVDNDDSVYGSIVENDRSFLLEFNDTTNYDIAIYNAENNTFTYYKNVDGTFTEVTLS